MAEPATPLSLTGEKMGYAHAPDGTAALVRVVNPAVMGTAVNPSAPISIASWVLHDGADPSAEGPIKTGGKANAAAPSAVSENDRVNSWHGLAGDQRVSIYGGVVAHDGVDSGGAGPVKIGGRAQAPTADPEEVADDDRVDAFFDRNGRLAVHAGQVPKTAAINCASSGDNTIVSAVSGKRIAVWAWNIIVEGAVDVRWEDGAAGTAKSGQYAFTEAGRGLAQAAGGLVPLWIGTSNTLLNLELSGAVQVMGQVSYTEWDD